MIIQETRIDSNLQQEDGIEIFVSGYFLTIDELIKLTRDFQVDCFDGFVSNDKAYIDAWLEKHKRII